MALPTLKKTRTLLASNHKIKQRVLAIAKRLEALKEYGPEQALLVAVDIVLTRDRLKS